MLDKRYDQIYKTAKKMNDLINEMTETMDTVKASRKPLNTTVGYMCEVKRQAKVGEYVKIVNTHPCIASLKAINYYPNIKVEDIDGDYKNGDILKIIQIDDYGCCYGKGKGQYLFACEYVVLEEYKPITKETGNTLEDLSFKEYIDNKREIRLSRIHKNGMKDFIAFNKTNNTFVIYGSRDYRPTDVEIDKDLLKAIYRKLEELENKNDER